MKIFRYIRSHPLQSGMTASIGMIAVIGVLLLRVAATEPVDSFAACAEAGYPITQGNPPVCHQGSYYMIGPVDTSTTQAAAVNSQPFDLLVNADSRTTTPRAQVVVHTQEAWVAWWQKLHAGLVLPPLLPVDFTSHDVIIIVEGPKVTTGYNFKVTAVSQGKKATVIDTSESEPTIGCQVDNRLSNRYYVVRTAKLPEPVVFRNTTVSRRCN